MSQNLAEFLKVLTIVVSFSSLILIGRHAMLSLDDVDEEADSLIDKSEEVETV